MNDNLFLAVTLDGKELNNLSERQIKELFFLRQINQNSLVCAEETRKWQMLKRVFDISQWLSAASPPASSEANNQQNQSAPPNSPPDDDASQPTLPPNFLPPHKSSQAVSNQHAPQDQSGFHNQTHFQSDKYDFANNFQAANSSERTGARQAAVFICINAVFFLISMIFSSIFESAAGADDAGKIGSGVGRSIIPLIIDLMLASRLWKNQNIDSTRRWVLVRAYFGFLIFGLVVPYLDFRGGDYVTAILSFIAAVFYFVSLTIVLHGKTNPTPHRVMIGVGTFAVYFLFIVGLIGFSLVAAVAPNLGNFAAADTAALEQYKIEGTDFQDPQSGARIRLPEGWMMLDLKNPIISSPDARMIAVDRPAQSLTMLEIVPVPVDVSVNEVQSNKFLESLTDYVAESINEQNKTKTFAESNFREITRVSVYVGKNPAKLLVFEKTVNREKVKGHLIITFDDRSLYILHSWCPAKDYETAQNDFLFFEKSFGIPERAAAPFSQTAETGKNLSDAPKNF